MLFKLLQAAESGNLEEFIRLYQGDNGRLAVQDTRGRTVSHQASARNRVNILQYIHAQQGSEYYVQDKKFLEFSHKLLFHLQLFTESQNPFYFMLRKNVPLL